MERSAKSSIKSQGSVKSKQESIKRRVEKFNQEKKQYSGEKDDEYAERRKRKTEKKQRVQRDRKLRRYKCFYWPSAIAMTCGCCFTFGSTVKSLGEGTIFWGERHIFKILGPILTGIGFILFMITNAVVNIHLTRIKKINQEEDVKNKEARKERILQRYIRKRNGFYNISKLPITRSISANSSATCHSIEELEDSRQMFFGTMSTASNSSLHPFWKPLVKKDSTESNGSCSKLLESSLTSTSTLMTSIHSNDSTSLNFQSALRKIEFIDETKEMLS